MVIAKILALQDRSINARYDNELKLLTGHGSRNKPQGVQIALAAN